MRKFAALAISVALLVIGPAGRPYAMDKDGVYTDYGIGRNSCATFMKDINSSSRVFSKADYTGWLGGYISAHNFVTDGTKDILAGTDMEGAFGWLQNYCRSHPIDNFAKAVQQLILFLKSRSSLDEGSFIWTRSFSDRPAAFIAIAATENVRSGAVDVKYRGPVNLAPFKCDSITRSSFIHDVCYDVKNTYMLINLNGTWYQYCEIDRGTVEGLLGAESMGRFYNASIKGSFDCRTHRVPAY